MFKFLNDNNFNKFQSTFCHFVGNYTINDPTTPSLTEDIKQPPNGVLKYLVKGINYPPKNTNDLRASNCNISIGNCIEKVQNHVKNPITKWASTNVLLVNPVAGPELNAYYDRKSLKFFYTRFNGKNVYFSDSQDIVTHELGHALLDAMRPDFWSVQSLEIWSFHEAFSDIVSMFNLMNYEKALQMAIEETNGDLKKSNVISRLAEEVGILIREMTKNPAYLHNALRDPAVENFDYIDPKFLPKESPNDKLSAECHSFGRVFSNAWYKIFVKIYEYQLSLKKDPLESAKMSRDISFSIMIKAIPNTARVVKYYENLAESMVSVARSKGMIYENIVKKVFVECKILDDQKLKAMSNICWKDVVNNLKKDDVVFKNKNYTIACIKNNIKIKSSDLNILKSMSSNNDFELEAPADSYFKFNNKGKLIMEVKPNYEEIKETVSNCFSKISNNIGKNKMWNIEKNKLLRKFIF